MQTLQTLKTESALAVNSLGEILGEVQIRYVSNSSGVTITVSSLAKVLDVHPKANPSYDWWLPRRDLITISTELTGGPEATDDIGYSRHLKDELIIWGPTPELERLIRVAVSEGLHIVNTVDSTPEPTPPYPRDAFEHQGFQYRRGVGRYFSRLRFPFLMR
jgi:hypothetical protein